MATTYSNIQMSVVDASGNVNVIYPQTRASIVTSSPSTTGLSSSSTTVEKALTELNSKWKSIGVSYKKIYDGLYSYKTGNEWDNTSIKITLPVSGVYLFVLLACPCATGNQYDALTIGVTGLDTIRAQKTFALAYGKDFYPSCTHSFAEHVNAGTYGLAIWSSYARIINHAGIFAIRIG